MSVRSYNQRSKLIISILTLFLIGFFIFFGLIIPQFEILFLIILPILILIIIGAILIKFSWNPQNYCSRCNYPVSIYAEFCRNCGLKLISKCPNCNSYIREGISRCNTCGYIIDDREEPHELIEYEVIKKGDALPRMPNFCPTCGANLKNVKNLRFCEYCGSKLQ